MALGLVLQDHHLVGYKVYAFFGPMLVDTLF